MKKLFLRLAGWILSRYEVKICIDRNGVDFDIDEKEGALLSVKQDAKVIVKELKDFKKSIAGQ